MCNGVLDRRLGTSTAGQRRRGGDGGPGGARAGGGARNSALGASPARSKGAPEAPCTKSAPKAGAGAEDSNFRLSAVLAAAALGHVEAAVAVRRDRT